MNEESGGGGLCLSRRLGESIVIGPGTRFQCTITFSEWKRGEIRLLFHAPKEVRIFRAELLDREEFKVDGGGRNYVDLNELGS